MGSRYLNSVLSVTLLFSFTATAKAEVINGINEANYTLLLGPNKYRSPLVGTKTVTESLSVFPAPQEAELYIVNGSGEDLSPSNCSGLPVLQKIACTISNAAKIVRLNLERPRQIEISLNGVVLVTQNTLTQTTNSLLLPITLESENQLRIKLKGSIFSYIQVSVRGLDHISPVINLASPTENQAIEGLSFDVLATSNERLQSASLSIAGEGSFPLSLSGDGLTITGEITSGSPGPKVLTLTARDPAGNETVVQRSIRLNFNRPPEASLTLASSGTGIAPLIVLFEASQSSDPDGDLLQYRFDFDDGTVITGTNPKVSHEFQNTGNFDVEVRVTDPSGLSSSATIAVSVTSPTLPEDPAQYAPPLSQTEPQSFNETISFLYEGPNAVQVGVSPGAIRTDRVATISGKVLDQDGQPLSGVKVSSLGKSALGHTLSREDGEFDIAVNFGGITTLKFERNGFASASRDLKLESQSMHSLEDVLLVKRDSKVTTLSSNSNVAQVAQGTTSSDSAGERTATVVIPPGTGAKLQMPSGALIDVDTLNIRMTEFTVGPDGPKRMPAALPLQTAYTYALEVTTDEAIASGAESVVFSKPVSFYVDNFLSLPAGIAMPLGFLNPKTGYWEAEKDGVVISVLSHLNNQAVLDIGGGQPATQVLLDHLGIDSTELEKIASLYQPGQSFWRVRMNHFSVYDLNGNANFQQDQQNPGNPTTNQNDLCANVNGCVIDIVSGTLSESIALPGTGTALHYSTRRGGTRSDNARVTVQVLTPEYPDNLQVSVNWSVAGKTEFINVVKEPNAKVTIEWDGRDRYGRQIYGNQEMQITTIYKQSGYYYFLYYDPENPSTWANPPPPRYNEDEPGIGLGIEMPLLREHTTFKSQTVTVRPPIDSATLWAVKEAGRWTLEQHHFLDRQTGNLFMGNGGIKYASSLPRIVRHLAGTTGGGFSGDGGPASTAKFNFPRNFTFDNDGNILIADILNNRIRKIDRLTGIITTIAGSGSTTYSGDGGQALNAGIAQPIDLSVDRDGNIYFSDYLAHRVRKIDTSGVITTIAGNGVAGYSGDGGLATAAQLNGPRSVIANPDGSVYVSEQFNHVVRKIDPSGIITTFAGTGTQGYTGDGGPATEAEFSFPNYTATDSAGNLYVAQDSLCAIRKITPTGFVSTIAGTGACTFWPDGEPATASNIGSVASVAVSKDGIVYFADRTNHRIRMIDKFGLLQTVIGTGQTFFNGLNRTGQATNLNLPTDVEVRPDGSLVFIEYNRNVLREYVQTGIRPALNYANSVELASDDGSEIFVFDDAGKHLVTLYGETRQVKFTFSYDQDGRLTAMTDAFQNRTEILRSAGGMATQVVSPFGQTYNLAVSGTDGDEDLDAVTYPTGERYEMQYDTNGLMTHFRKPRGGESRFYYDLFGRLYFETDPSGGTQRVYSNARETRLGQWTFITHAKDQVGSEFLFKNVGGVVYANATLQSGLRSSNHPTRTITNTAETTDPRLLGHSMYPSWSETVFPEGGAIRTNTLRSYTSTPDSFQRTERTETNQGWFETQYSSSTRIYSSSTSEGRVSSVSVDQATRPIRVQVGSLEPTLLSYDGRGRLSTLTQGSRNTEFTYDQNGSLLETRNALGQVTRTEFDDSMKLTSSTNPNLETVGFGYDLDRNLSEIVLPGNVLHQMASSALDFLSNYRTPLGRDLGLLYSFDKELTQVNRADGKSVQYVYEQNQRRFLSQIQTEAQTVFINYLGDTPMVSNIQTSDGSSIGFSYNGTLPTLKSHSSPFNASIGVTYNPVGMLPSAINVAGSVVPVLYNTDREPISIGDLGLFREQQTGLLTGLGISTINEAFGYNTYGELESKNLGSLGGETYQRDNLGRIIFKTTSLGGQNETSSYTYDPAGRLARVVRIGAHSSDVRYTYDNRGNRTAVNRDGSVTSGTYDTEDRLLSYGDLRFTYTDHGDLLEKENIVTGQKITLTYDQRAQLTRAALSGGRVITYTIDGEGKRLSRSADGILTAYYLHDFAGRLAAEVEIGGALRTHFVYASQSHSPDYMIRGGVRYYFAKDQLGSIRAVINADTGTVAQAIHYDEFGRVLADTNPGFQPFGFAGGHYDHETGLVRFGARDYDSEVGRWTARDPILFNGGDTNMYRYVNDDPVTYVDPSGTRLTVGSQSGSMKEIARIWKAIGNIRKTPYGEKLYQKLQASDTNFVVWAACGATQSKGSHSSGTTPEVFINLLNVENAWIFFEGSNGRKDNTYSLERIVAHEMSHWLTRDENKAVQMENRIVEPLENNSRLRY